MDSVEHDNVALEDLENEPALVNSSVGKKRVRSTHSEVWEYFQKNEVAEGEKQTCYCKECKKSYMGGRLYGNDYGERFEVVETKLKGLYEEYKKIEKESNNEASGSKELDCGDSMGPYLQEFVDVMEEFDMFRNFEFAESSHNSELKLYLEDGPLDRKLPLDILSCWKSQKLKYPILSLMAKDVLAVPITTVASESAFSIGGRVLDEYRSSLKNDIVEALLCTRDWLYGNAIVMEAEQEDEDVSKFHIDVEQFTQVPTPSLGDH